MRRATVSSGLLLMCVFVNTTWADPVVNVGSHRLLPDTPDQTVEIMVSGGDEVQGITFRAQIADGGTDPRVGGTIDGPRITGVDLLTGTIFDGNNTGQSNVLGWDQVWVTSTTTSTSVVAASGLLARITFDTTGFQEGAFALSLADTRDGATDFAGIPIAIQDGTISIVPEPGLLGLGILGFTSIVWQLRRNQRRCLRR